MKNFNITLILIFIFAYKSFAQDGYTYTLVDNGGYSYTVQAVPNASTSNFSTSVQSYGFTIILTDGITASITSSLGSGADATFFDGNNVGQSAIDGYLVTEVLGSPVTLPAPSAATNSNIVTLQVNGSPTSGSISILANDSPLATTVTALKSFMSADMVDDGMAMFPNVVDPNTSALSGTTSYMFSTLTIEEEAPVNDTLTIFPNPTSGVMYINSTVKVNAYIMYDVLGKQLSDKSNTLDGNKLDISKLPDGVYLLKLILDNNSSVVREIIKN